MMEIIQGLVLGVIQGLTEFFPVSSSGHLILAPNLLGWEDQGTAFDTVLHLGTLAALLWFFRSTFVNLVKGSLETGDRGRSSRRFLLQVIIASFPVLLLAVLLKDVLEQHARNPSLVAFDLAFWGLVLFAADRFSGKQGAQLKDVESISWTQAILIGLAQPLSLLPGTSRSGITITAALFAGLSREAAARFSFLLSVPVTAAAGLYGLMKITKDGSEIGGHWSMLLFGFMAAMISGAWAIRFLLSYVAKKHFDAFIVYRLALALCVLLFV